MPVRQTGNWAPPSSSPVGIDIFEYANANNPLLYMQGGASRVPVNQNWWDTAPNNASFFWQNVGGEFDGQARELRSSDEALPSWIGNPLPMVVGAQRMPAAIGGDVLPTLRVRVNMLAQVAGPTTMPNDGLLATISRGGGVGEAHVGPVVGLGGVYVGVSEKRSAAARVVLPVAGAIDARVPHMIDFEYFLGSAQRLIIRVAGTTVYDKTFAGAMFSRSVGFPFGGNLMTWFIKSGNAGGPFALWRLYGTRVRYDYV